MPATVPVRSPRVARRLAQIGLGLVLALGLAVSGIALWPLGLERLDPRGAGPGWEELLADLAAADADPALLPPCHSIVLPGRASNPDVVILLHGLTNCPEQFRAFGRLVVDVTGRTVLIPRLPHHGERDRLTDSPRHLTAEALTAVVEEAVAASRSRGGRVAIVGLSLGATLAGWAAQHLEVERAILIAPVAGAPGISPAATPSLVNVSRLLHRRFAWWDAELREQVPGPVYAYPRFALAAVGQTLRLGLAVEAAAGARPPRCRDLIIVTNASDEAVHPEAIERLAARWSQWPGVRMRRHEFPREADLNHDVIDPTQVRSNPGLVYPVLLDLLIPSGGPTRAPGEPPAAPR